MPRMFSVFLLLEDIKLHRLDLGIERNTLLEKELVRASYQSAAPSYLANTSNTLSFASARGNMFRIFSLSSYTKKKREEKKKGLKKYLHGMSKSQVYTAENYNETWMLLYKLALSRLY